MSRYASRASHGPYRLAAALLISSVVLAAPVGALAGPQAHTYDFRKPSGLGSSVRGPANVTVDNVNPLRYFDAHLAETRTTQQNSSPGGLFGLGQAAPILQNMIGALTSGGGNKMALANEFQLKLGVASQCTPLSDAIGSYDAALRVEGNIQADKGVVQAAIADFQPLFGQDGPADPVTPAMEIARDKSGHIVSYHVDANHGVVATDAVNAYDKDVQDAQTTLSGIPRAAYAQQCRVQEGASAGQLVSVGDAVGDLTPELKDRSSGGTRYEAVHSALDDLRDWATHLYAAAADKNAYQVSRSVDCHDAHGFTSSTVAVTLDATDATKEPTRQSSTSTGDNRDSTSDGGNGTHKGTKKNDGHSTSKTDDPSSVSVDVVTVECYAPLTATNGGTLSSIPQQAFTVAPTPGTAATKTRGKGSQPSQQTGTIQLSTNKSSQTSYNPAAISYRLPILQNDAGTDISLTAALSNAASGMAGLTFSFERSIFLTAAVIRADYSSLGDGYTLGEAVPLHTKLPVIKMPTTRFALMLSFPTPANGLFSRSKKRDQGSGDGKSGGNNNSNGNNSNGNGNDN